jgi:hypothetical protein
LAAVLAAQSTAGTDAAGIVRYANQRASDDDGTVLLVIAVLLTVILSLMIGACVGALLSYKLFKTALAGLAMPAPAAEPAPAPAAAPAPDAAPAPAAAPSLRTSATQTEFAEEHEHFDDPDCLESVRWVTKSRIKYHRYKCAGTNGYEVRKVTPRAVCANMKNSFDCYAAFGCAWLRFGCASLCLPAGLPQLLEA